MDEKHEKRAPPDTRTGKESLLASTAKGASYLVLLQLASRMLTFALHQIILRYTTAETLGIASVKLELLLSTILFISREGFRCALLRNDDNSRTHGKQTEQATTNLAYIPTAVGLCTTILACGYYLSLIDNATAAKYPFYRLSIVLFGVAAFAELLVEPLFILALNGLHFQLRVSVEGVAVVLRCFCTFGLTLWGSRGVGSENTMGVLAFAVGQCVFGLTLAIGYVSFFARQVRAKKREARSLWPQKLHSGGKAHWFDSRLPLAVTMTKQSLLKHVLTEGDKMLISALSTDDHQGVYAFVVNYGSLVARILFQPLEETGRTFFSKWLATGDGGGDVATAAVIVQLMIRAHVLLGLVFACFGTNYTATLIDLLVGRAWSVERDAPAVLAMYCLYVPVMGINGITEAFVQAVASEADLARLSYAMFGFSACFMMAGYVLMRLLDLGATGLVLANMINLGIRITYSWYYIQRFFGNKNKELTAKTLTVRQWLPSLTTLTAFSLSWAITSWSEHTVGWLTLKEKAIHIGIGGACFIGVAFVTLYKERSFFRDIKRIAAQKKQD